MNKKIEYRLYSRKGWPERYLVIVDQDEKIIDVYVYYTRGVHGRNNNKWYHDNKEKVFAYNAPATRYIKDSGFKSLKTPDPGKVWLCKKFLSAEEVFLIALNAKEIEI